MLKKGISIILTALFILMLSTATFAGIQLNPVEPEDIELIAPKIGSERQVFVKDSMAISIRSVEVDVSLFKVMPSSHNVYLDEACGTEMVLMAEDVPFKVISGSSIVAKDAFIDSKADDETETTTKTVIEKTDTVDSDEIIDGSQALLQKDRLSSKDRQEVIQSYKDARNAFENKLDALESSYKEYMELFPEGHVDEHEYTDEELKVIKAYLIATEEVHELCKAYEEAKNQYEAIFEIPLFGPEDVSDTGILPYYQKTVEKITPGLYKFVFSDQIHSEVIQVVEFEVVKKEELTEEVIKEAMPSSVGDLLLPSVDLIDSKEIITQPAEVIEEKPEEKIEEKTEDKTEVQSTINEKDQLEPPAEENTDE